MTSSNAQKTIDWLLHGRHVLDDVRESCTVVVDIMAMASTQRSTGSGFIFWSSRCLVTTLGKLYAYTRGVPVTVIKQYKLVTRTILICGCKGLISQWRLIGRHLVGLDAWEDEHPAVRVKDTIRVVFLLCCVSCWKQERNTACHTSVYLHSHVTIYTGRLQRSIVEFSTPQRKTINTAKLIISIYRNIQSEQTNRKAKT